MAKNLAALQKALEKGAPPTATSETAPQTPAVAWYKAPSREGKTNITAYLSPDYKRSLRLIQARTNRSLQALVAEALNDLFAKHNVPTIDHE